MKERPILFSGAMVRALLAGTKTQTRRVCKPAATLSAVVEIPDPLERGQVYNGSHFGDEDGNIQFASPYGCIGDRLWVRESFSKIIGQSGGWIETDYRATYTHGDRLGDTLGIKKRWTPSIHMPRDASRITLEVTGVRVERLKDISEADARAEGCKPIENGIWWKNYTYPAGIDGKPTKVVGYRNATQSYRSLWELINGPDSWQANPWVWVVKFRKVAP